MSVVTYYGRVSDAELESMCASPSGLAQFVDGTLPEERMLYLDKAAPVIAWLVSPLKRHEQLHFAAVVNAGSDLENFKQPDFGPEPPFDDLLIPTEGRGPKKDERLDVGMGPACVIASTEVSKYTGMLSAIGETQLRQQLDFKALDEACLPVDYWQEEGEQTFAEYILPLFERLQAFYSAAAKEKQHVLVWCS